MTAADDVAMEELARLAEGEGGNAAATMAKLMHANLVDYQTTAGQLIAGQQEEILDLRAQLAAIRWQVQEILSRPFAPAEHVIRDAVMSPNPAVVAQCRRNEERISIR